MKKIKSAGRFVTPHLDPFFFDTIVIIEGNEDFAKYHKLIQKTLGKISNSETILCYTVGSDKFTFDLALTSSDKHDKIIKINIFNGRKNITYYLF